MRSGIKLITGVLFVFAFILKANTAESPSFISDSGFIDERVLLEVSESPEWLALCHYDKTIFGGYESKVQGKNFFLHPDGKYNPLLELKSCINLFNNDVSTGKENARSRFPARLQFLEKRLNLQKRIIPCQELEEYLKRTKTRSIAIVYSSYYPNNPASIFGHTFLKLDSGQVNLLEYGVNFTAVTDGSSGILYTAKGLFGFFPGKYSMVKFHDKVREYNDYENRDLWIYHLQLNDEQRDLLTKHIWELSPSYYDYYFFTENCAYHGISVFDPLFPKRRLSDNTKKFVIPIDTIKLLDDEKLINRHEYLPSLKNIFIEKYSILSTEQKSDFHRYIETMKLSEKKDRQVLNALLAYYNYKYPSAQIDILNNKTDYDAYQFRNSIILTRKDLEFLEESSQLEKSIPTSPHLMHGSNRVSLFFGTRTIDNYKFIRPEYRFSYHDLSDPSRGYPVNTEIELGKLSFDIYKSDSHEKTSFAPNEVTILKITCLNDISFYQKSMSWSAYIGGKRSFDRRSGNDGAFAPEIAFSFGASKIFSKNYSNETSPALILYAMIITSAAYSQSFIEDPYSFGVGPTAGIKFVLTEKITATTGVSYIRYTDNTKGIYSISDLRCLAFNNISIDLSYHLSVDYSEAKISIMKYF